MRRIVIGFGVVAAALALTGSSGAGRKTRRCPSSPTRRPSRDDQADPRLPGDAGGQRRLVHASYGGSSEQAAAVVAGLTADIVVLCTGRTSTCSSTRASSTRSGTTRATAGSSANSVVVFAPSEREPEEDQGVERPAQAGRRGDHAEPVHVRHREVEHHRRRTSPSGTSARPTSRRTASSHALPARRLAGHVGSQRDEHVPLRARATSCSPTRARRSRPLPDGNPVRDPAPDDADRHLPIAVTKKSQHKDEVNAFIRFLKSAAGAGVLGPNGYRPVNKQVVREVAKQVPGAPGRDHDQRQDPRRLARRGQEVVRPEHGHHGGDREGLGVSTLARPSPTHPGPAAPRDQAFAEGEGRHGPLARFRHHVPLGDRRAADRGARLGVDEERRRRLLGHGLDPGGGRRR